MSPDDPRHGKYAGYIAHHKRDVPLCDPCVLAGRRARKRLAIRGPQRVVLGEEAYRKLVNTPKNALSKASGLRAQHLHHIESRGPEARVHQRTRAKILAAPVITPIGLTRRVQALARIGWSAAAIARAAGVSVDNVRDLRNATDRQFIRSDFAEAITGAYDQLHMRVPPKSRATARQINAAIKNGWPGPLAYDDIDDPKAAPRLTQPARDDEYDEAAVIRLISGEHIPARPADKIEAMRRWVAKGGSARELCRIHGWKEGRYVIGVAA